ncbi:MAG TPA: hypothetical protein VN683_12720 [Acidothermaceae bacterium]|nr:hypothetical protein [Acidothermaceae bacterium]
MFRLRSTLGVALGVSLVALNLAACSKSGAAKAGAASSPSTQETTSTAATTAPSAPAQNGSAAASSAAPAAATSAAPAAAASGAPASGEGEPLAPIGCGGITPAMVNDLVTTPVTSITYSSGSGIYEDHHFECDAGMQVDIYPQDSNKAQYTADLAAENAAANPLSGVGDVAVYTLAPFAGMPDVYAHKGTVTCELKPSSTVSDYKITVDPSSLTGAATKDAQAAWATKAAGLCTGVFTALKA